MNQGFQAQLNYVERSVVQQTLTVWWVTVQAAARSHHSFAMYTIRTNSRRKGALRTIVVGAVFIDFRFGRCEGSALRLRLHQRTHDEEEGGGVFSVTVEPDMSDAVRSLRRRRSSSEA